MNKPHHTMKDHHHWKHHRCKGGFGGFLFKGLLVMLLWNALVPALFAGPAIGYFQSLGLMLLAHLLTGGFRKGRRMRGWGGHGSDKMRKHWKRKMREKWNEMSEEEKTRFRDQFRRGPYEVNVFDVEVEEEEEQDDKPQA